MPFTKSPAVEPEPKEPLLFTTSIDRDGSRIEFELMPDRKTVDIGITTPSKGAIYAPSMSLDELCSKIQELRDASHEVEDEVPF
jgi:hypothetical protein